MAAKILVTPELPSGLLVSNEARPAHRTRLCAAQVAPTATQEPRTTKEAWYSARLQAKGPEILSFRMDRKDVAVQLGARHSSESNALTPHPPWQDQIYAMNIRTYHVCPVAGVSLANLSNGMLITAAGAAPPDLRHGYPNKMLWAGTPNDKRLPASPSPRTV